ncbi:MAG: glutaminyl-peptide cyclotransferase [Culturomica sp.]|jgi:glutamine cyclotransferase|nr:glutaminyl-peptide cyclotransferase [Culturomica sp.]
MSFKILIVYVFTILLIDANNIFAQQTKSPVEYTYEIVNTYPHDPHAYTQGLVYHDGWLYEGTGGNGKSSLRKVEIKSGKPRMSTNLAVKYFGEGITILNNQIYQLTWMSRQGFIYDLNTFSPVSTFSYNTQGWGITTVDNYLVMSDGSEKLYCMNPANGAVFNVVEVHDNKGIVKMLNELEYIDGKIWANVWLQDIIVMIDPDTGTVSGKLDLAGILPSIERRKLDKNDDVLNGIAYNPESKTVYVTGKNWSKLFEIRVRRK